MTVTANSTNRVQGATNPVFTVSYSGFVLGQNTGVLSGTPGVTTSAMTNSPAGTYAIVATNGTLSAVNYSFAFCERRFDGDSAGRVAAIGQRDRQRQPVHLRLAIHFREIISAPIQG